MGPGFCVAIHITESLLWLGHPGRAGDGLRHPGHRVCLQEASCSAREGRRVDPVGPRGGISPAFGQQETKSYSQQPRPAQVRGQTRCPFLLVLPTLPHLLAPGPLLPVLTHSGLPSRVLPTPAHMAHALVCPHGHPSLWVSVQKILRRESQDGL